MQIELGMRRWTGRLHTGVRLVMMATALVAQPPSGESPAADLASELQFVGFEVDPRLQAEEADVAAEGRALLLGGQAFRNGLPESTYRILRALVPPEDASGAFAREGVLPSPPSRPLELGGLHSWLRIRWEARSQCVCLLQRWLPWRGLLLEVWEDLV